MRHLPKHLQPRWRYLAVGLEAWPDAEVGRRALQRAGRAAARGLLGDPGAAAIDLSVLRFSFADGVGEAILRVRRGETDRARAALACVDAVDGQPVRVRVRGISGTVRAAEEKYMRGPSVDIEHTRVAFGGADRLAHRRGDLVDVETDGGFRGATRLDCE